MGDENVAVSKSAMSIAGEVECHTIGGEARRAVAVTRVDDGT